MERQILIKTAEAWFEFSKSRTGQIDFVGKVAETLKEDELLKGGGLSENCFQCIFYSKLLHLFAGRGKRKFSCLCRRRC